MADLPISNHHQDLYTPRMAKIIRTKQLTKLERWFEIELLNGVNLRHEPGQFVQVSLFGIGEAPISVTSAPTQEGSFELCIRKVGMLTDVLHACDLGATIGIRGPFGSGFDLQSFMGKDILIVAGGIGIVPLRSLINAIIDDRGSYGRLIILYGAKHPDELLYREELAIWKEASDIEVHVTVDRPSPAWQGHTGVITTLIPGLDIDVDNTITAVVGPPVMYKFVLMALNTKRIPENNIYLSLERRMKCGVGKCGHCQINHSYVCQNGPVYHYPYIKNLQEAI